MTATTLATVLADAAGGAGGTLGALLPLVAFGAIFYFLIIRPQRKRQREQEELQDSLGVGSDVVTIGGMHGTIDEMGDTWVDLAVDADGTILRFQRQAIARTISADADADADADDEAVE